jgi:hypothetical protein
MREAQDLISGGLVGAAADLLGEFVEEQPNNHEALHLISRAYLIMDQKEIAASFLRRSVIAEKSAGISSAAGQFRMNDAQYYNDGADVQSEYTPGQEYDLVVDAIELTPNLRKSEEKLADSTVESFDLDAAASDWMLDEYTADSPEVEGWENIILDDQLIDIDEEQIDYEEVEYKGRITPRQRSG